MVPGHGLPTIPECGNSGETILQSTDSILQSTEEKARMIDLSQYKILVVDDEEDTRLFISTVLADQGAEVCQACDGVQALEAVRREMPDLMTLELPDFVKFISDVDFVRDFGAAETTRPSAARLSKSIKTLVRPPISVHEDCGLLRAYALMLQHRLHDILVVTRDGKLAGIASRVDIGTAVLSAWSKVEKK